MTKFSALRVVSYVKSQISNASQTFLMGKNNYCGMQNQVKREIWLEQTLTSIPQGWRILDAGAGETKYRRFCQHLNYISQDFAQYNGQGNGQGLQTVTWDQSKIDIISDITNIPEPDASFDAVMCIEVLEHIPDPISALRELSRLTRLGGTLIITAPIASLTHFAPYFFYTGYSRHFYEKWLPEVGFEIESITPNGNYFEYLAQELRRCDSVAQRYAPGVHMSRLRNIARWALIGYLAKGSRLGSSSSDLLAFGWHVKAIKIG